MNSVSEEARKRWHQLWKGIQRPYKLIQIFPFRNGGTLSMSRDVMLKQLDQIKTVAKENRHNMIPEVRAFKNTIENNSYIKSMLQCGIKLIPLSGILSGIQFNQFFNILNTTCISPPKYQPHSLAGVPFSWIFMDLMNTVPGQTFFSSPIVNRHLKSLFEAYRRMLESPESLKYVTTEEPHGWLSPLASSNINWSQHQINVSDPHWGFKSYNHLFTRPIKPEVRPIDKGKNVIVHSSDSQPLYFPSKEYGQNPTFNAKAKSSFWLKDNHYSLYDMFGVQKRPDMKKIVDEHFVGGAVYQAYLRSYFYHRWHAPVSGTIIKSYQLGEGSYFMSNPKLSVGKQLNGGVKNYVDSQQMLTMTSTRHIYVIRIDDGSDRCLAVIEVGMVEVSGCLSTVEQGQKINKGDQLGYFQYGGSSYAIVFDRNLELQFSPDIFQVNENGEVSKKLVNSYLAKYK